MFRKLVFSEVSFRFLTVTGSQFTASDECIVMCRNSVLYGRLRIVFYDLGGISPPQDRSKKDQMKDSTEDQHQTEEEQIQKLAEELKIFPEPQ